MGSAPCFSCKLICWLDDCTKLTKITQSKGCQTKLSGFTVDVSVSGNSCAAQPCEESTDFPESPERRAQAESPSRQGAAAWLETKEPLETQLPLRPT